ncbi:hypothetical protein VM98_16540 [Streptomyces rubellomurinus subsp. indigoferus]|uniref:Uncharacterized protein n=1 Tax=Streptomyces rubellomurinus (strain ATCC 31215) TaxID=359131 RepID=A0A0F2TES4_STRR3|nr:DUF6087 family protein [Streptomyces rubellomurinus]KJS54898.1 hypothetical protein VM98_16540 [Streptomyces rubellomurinus subsp. indigoferus]KJS61006.1 hypothetical protein VM95_17835 [Streptomyces rubellomurinus]
MLGADDDGQSIARWYGARAGRVRPVGTRDALALGPAPRRGALFEDAVCLVVEWDGACWRPLGVADGYAEAYTVIVRRGEAFAAPQEDTPVALLRKGSGRHRRADEGTAGA